MPETATKYAEPEEDLEIEEENKRKNAQTYDLQK